MNLAAALPAIEGWGSWAYAALFVVALAEALPLIGTAIPGATTVAVVGLAASQGILALGPSFWIVAAGAALGDVGGYLIGVKTRGAFTPGARFLNERHLIRGQAFFARYGGASVLLGRFAGPLRATVPLVAGASRMPFWSFLFWNVLSALLWSAVWLALGFVSGGAILSIYDALRALL